MASENGASGGAAGVAEPKAGEANKRPTVSAILAALQRGETLYTLRFKGTRGPQNVVILAKDDAEAEKVGRCWVNQDPGRLYLTTEPMVVATATILKTSNPDANVERPERG